MSTKPPSGSGLAADSIEDSIETILLEANEKPLANPLAPPSSAPTLGSLTPPPMMAATNSTPLPIVMETPAPVAMTSTPSPVMTKTPLPAHKTPSPSLKTPGPVVAGNRDPSSVLPTIPAARKESSGAFPLPGMAPPDGDKSTDEDATLIARLSVLDDLAAEEPTKIEPLEAALRAAASTEEPINLADQATAERDRALAVSAADRVSAAEFEEPGDDDELTVSATPGIISISDDDDEEDTTASQRPQGAPRKTPAPVLAGSTPVPITGGPRLPAPSLSPGRSLRQPTPSGGLQNLQNLAASLSAPPPVPLRSATPALPIPAPLGAPAPAPASASAVRSAIFKLVHIPVGGLVFCLATVFLVGLLVGSVFSRGAATTSVAEVPTLTATPPATPAPAKEEPAAPSAPAATAEPAKPTEAPAAAAEPAKTEPAAPKPEPAVAHEPEAPAAEPEAAAEEPKPIRHVALPRPRILRKPIAAAPEEAAPAKLAAKPAAAAPAAAKPAAAPAATAAAKPAAAPAAKPVASSTKAGGKAGKKAWVDPFAE